MIIRTADVLDIPEVNRLHERYFPNLEHVDYDSIVSPMVIENNHQIVVAGGIKIYAEIVSVSNLAMPIRTRREAYLKFLHACMYVSNRLGYDKIHTFAVDSKWVRVLMKKGFKPVEGTALYVDV